MIEPGATEAVYAGGSAMSVTAGGPIHVVVEDAVTDLSAPVYVRVTASGSNTTIGKLSPSAGTGKVKCSKLAWDRASDSLLIATVEVA